MSQKKVLQANKNRKRILFVIYYFVAVYIFLTMVACSKTEEKSEKTDDWIYGITVDDSWYDTLDIEQVVDAIRDMPVKPTVRIVMSNEISPEKYKKLFMEIDREAYIMASPVDSYYMNAYRDKETYLKRFKDSYDELYEYVDIWEVGNEINGVEWIKQNPELIMDKVSIVNEFIKSKGGKTAVTLYYTIPEKEDMFDWISSYFSDNMCRDVDYVLISYYEDDNEGYIPDWEKVFSSLEKSFPSSKFGIGECGNTSEHATAYSKINMAHSYYTMKIDSKNFIGGYFWWNWVQDCVPHKNNSVYNEINRCVE